MKRILWCLALSALVFSSLILPATAFQQKDDQAWTKWTKKEAEKMLSDSPWSKDQVETNTAEMFFSPTSDPTVGRRTANDDQRIAGGATNQSINVKYVVRFFSARPVRRALVRLMELQSNPSADVVERLHSFADVKAGDSIIVTVTVQSSDQRSERAVMEFLNSAVTGTLKNDTYLERAGKRLFLEEYIPPGKDGFGARFIFLRHKDEKSFIEANTGDVRFYSKFPTGPRSDGPKIDRLFKVSDMMYNGELEY